MQYCVVVIVLNIFLFFLIPFRVFFLLVCVFIFLYIRMGFGFTLLKFFRVFEFYSRVWGVVFFYFGFLFSKGGGGS